jgi:hypothetical protein
MEEAKNAYRILIEELTGYLTKRKWLGVYFVNQMNRLFLEFPSEFPSFSFLNLVLTNVPSVPL